MRVWDEVNLEMASFDSMLTSLRAGARRKLQLCAHFAAGMTDHKIGKPFWVGNLPGTGGPTRWVYSSIAYVPSYNLLNVLIDQIWRRISNEDSGLDDVTMSISNLVPRGSPSWKVRRRVRIQIFYPGHQQLAMNLTLEQHDIRIVDMQFCWRCDTR